MRGNLEVAYEPCAIEMKSGVHVGTCDLIDAMKLAEMTQAVYGKDVKVVGDSKVDTSSSFLSRFELFESDVYVPKNADSRAPVLLATGGAGPGDMKGVMSTFHATARTQLLLTMCAQTTNLAVHKSIDFHSEKHLIGSSTLLARLDR